MLIRFAALLAALVAAVPARAEWMRASSRHFVIHADASEPELRDLATRLERFDGALRRFHGLGDNPAAAANPVTIYVTSSFKAVRRLAGRKDVGGFYVPRADGAVAFTPRVGDAGPNDVTAQIVLFHEYAHHFLLGNFALAYPAWYAEGYAELMSTAEIAPDRVWLGLAANHRAYGLLLAKNEMPAASLFAPPQRIGDLQQEQLYGRGWLLTHYLTFDAERRARLGRYLALLNAGVPTLDAARRAFGDLDRLDAELAAYLAEPTIPVVRFAVANLPPVQVAVRRMTAGERALIELRMASERGVDDKTARPLYARAKRAAVPANDAEAQGWLAEMAFDAGFDDEAEAAADRALAADPRSVQALMYKARVHLRRAVAAQAADPAVWAEAQSWIARASAVQPDAAGPLVLFHQSFGMAKAKPSAEAVAGLRRAFALVPQDPLLRLAVVQQELDDEKVEDAKRALRPLAFDPHLGADNPAAKLLALLEAGETGENALEALASGTGGGTPARR